MFRTCRIIAALAALAVLALAPFALRAQAAPRTISALFLSDIHFDPYADPAKVVKLNAAPAAGWNAILDADDSPSRAADFTALQKACPVRGVDTDNTLWQSSLEAILHRAYAAQFVTITGDLLAHQFDCKYKTLLPDASHADYLNFVEKTIQYVVVTLQTKVSSAVPLYIALGNNDSGCTDYALQPARDEFLARTATIVAGTLPASLSKAETDAVLRDFAAGGYYSAPLVAIPHTRILVLDDLFSSVKYVTCGGKPDPAPAAAELAWLEAQLAAARQHKEHVWVMGHIPPGVDLYSTARKLTNVCMGGQPQMFLGSESLAEILARNRDIVRLALFGHTHSDEMRLLTPSQDALAGTEATPAAAEGKKVSVSVSGGVPLKIVSSITPVNGNRPTFTLASIDPSTATLVDYTVMMASNLTGIDTTWSPEYTYSATYHQPAFDSASLGTLMTGFQADSTAQTPASEAYLRNYFPGDASAVIKFAWPQYACSLDHDSAADFTGCVCAAAK
jgi:sphingomyelin phosphodiesterase acid-like 3